MYGYLFTQLDVIVTLAAFKMYPRLCIDVDVLAFGHGHTYACMHACMHACTHRHTYNGDIILVNVEGMTYSV